MEADWEFEIGGNASVIEADWSGFVNLREHPGRVSDIGECRELPGLAEALVRLNAADSPVWTSKADVFTPEHIDPDGLDAAATDAEHAMACYIDLLLRSDQRWDEPSKAERECKLLCEKLRGTALRRCRVDIVVRRAIIAGIDDLGATIYFSACGSTLMGAKSRLAECIQAFIGVLIPAR